MTRRLLPTVILLGISLWSLNSLATLWDVLGIRASDAAEQRAALIGGDCAALPRLAASHPEELTLVLMLELAAHPDLRLRELTAHQAWTPHVNIQQQIKVVQALEPEQLRMRCELWLTRRATSQNTLPLNELQTYWNSKQ